MKILMVLDSHVPAPSDLRVEKEVHTLRESGREVFVLQRGAGKERWASLLRSLRYAIDCVDPAWIRLIESTLEQWPANVIHVHDLPLLKTALHVARPRAIPVVVDLHEHYPHAFIDGTWERGFKGWVAGLIFPKWRWERMERTCLRECSAVIQVDDATSAHYRGVDDVRIFVDSPNPLYTVRNTPDVARWPSMKLLPWIYNHHTLVYVGGLGYNRGLDTAIRALPQIRRACPGTYLMILGDGGSKCKRFLNDTIQDVGMRSAVTILSGLDDRATLSVMASSTIGVCMVRGGPTYEAGIPSKVFTYMALGLPVLVSRVGPMAEFVESMNAGLVFEPEHVGEFAKHVIWLLRHPRQATEMGERGQKNGPRWQEDGRNLCRVYEDLENNAWAARR